MPIINVRLSKSHFFPFTSNTHSLLHILSIAFFMSLPICFKPNGCIFNFLITLCICFSVPDIMASVILTLQLITPTDTAASPPTESISCLRIFACGAVRPSILRFRWSSFGAMSFMPTRSTPMRDISDTVSSLEVMFKCLGKFTKTSQV